MRRDELLLKLAIARRIFDDKVGMLPPDSLDEEVPGYGHSVIQLVSHVSAYDHLIIERLASAGHGAMTALDPDRGDRERFEEESWRFGGSVRSDKVLSRAEADFRTMAQQIGEMAEEELNARVGAAAALDTGWLRGRPPWQAILADTAAHYSEHYAMLDAAARAREVA